jgi:Arc/MetJ-type ribon-helix-helix transcriptional regulator
VKQVSIAISEDEIEWARSRVAAGEFPSIDAYFSELAQRDRASAEEIVWLQAEIDKGLRSGIDPRAPHQVFNDVRTKYLNPNG